jgi:hypothetical protein
MKVLVNGIEQDAKLTINGTDYELSPLRCKHLKEISAILKNGITAPTKDVYSEIEKWMPYIADSIKVKTPTFDASLLDEMTLQEFTDTWNAIVALSGIKVISNSVTDVSSVASPAVTTLM